MPIIVFNRLAGYIAFSYRVNINSGQLMTVPWEWSFSKKLWDVSTNDNALRTGLFEKFQTCYVHSSGCYATVLHNYHVLSLLVFKVTTELGWEKREGDKEKCHHAHCSTDSELFFLIKCSLDFSKSFLNFQSHENVWQCFSLFLWKQFLKIPVSPF